MEPISSTSHSDVSSSLGSIVLPIQPENFGPGETGQPRLKVLHVINGEHYSGAERVQDLLAGRLPEFGVDVTLACVKPKLFPEKRFSNAPLVRIPMRNAFDILAAGTLAKFVESEKFDIIHAHTPRTVLLASQAAWRTGVPYVYHVHSPTRADSTRAIRNWINAKVERWSLKRVSELVTVSGSLAAHMELEGFDRDIISTVRNGVACQQTVRDPIAPTGEWTIGTVALFRPRKGLEVLIDAVAALRKKNLPVKLRCIGGFETPDYQEEILARVKQHGLEDAVAWTGFVSDVESQLKKLDLFVLPSLFGEGLPMVILESMAAGVPVVATKVQGVPEAIESGREGLLCEPNSSTSLSAAIAAVIAADVDWKSLRDNALTRQRAEFSDIAMARGVASVYRKVLARV
jgi:glycosyltransferase involved in cell wall biosynthesis